MKCMNGDKIVGQKIFFFSVSLLLVVAVYFIFNFEYRTPILSGFIFAALTYPLFELQLKFVEKFKHRIGFLKLPVIALSTVIITFLVLSFFSTYVVSQLTREVNNSIPFLVSKANELIQSNQFNDLVSFLGFSKAETTGFSNTLSKQISDYAASNLNFGNLTNVYSVGSKLLTTVFNQLLFVVIFIIAWYNGLVFGAGWVRQLVSIIPIETHQKELIKKDLQLGIRNVIYANLVSGLTNGIIVFLIMSIFSIPGAFIAFIFAFSIGFLPLTPSELSYIPALIYLFFVNPILALVLAIILELFLLFLNYVLLPKVVLTGTQGNPLFIITSVLSGITIFGLMGFIIGPTIMIFITTFSSIIFTNIKQGRKVSTE